MRTEFQFIQHIKNKYQLSLIGDDCAVLPLDKQFDMVITCDMLVEDIDFRLDWTAPEFLGYKALAVSLSDIAAMGATPKWAMLSIAVPEERWRTDFLDELYEGWHQLAREFDVELVGGDISRSPGKLLIDSTVIGNVPAGKAILRSGAIPGDAVLVSGSLGGAAVGLRLLENGLRIDSAADESRQLIERLLKPSPRLALAKRVQNLNSRIAMIDISDGVAADLHQICEASKVGASIEQAAIPIDPSIGDFATDHDALEAALHGGEDFELLFTVPEERSRELDEYGVFTQIGFITERIGELTITENNKIRRLEPRGYQHFRSS